MSYNTPIQKLMNDSQQIYDYLYHNTSASAKHVLTLTEKLEKTFNKCIRNNEEIDCTETLLISRSLSVVKALFSSDTKLMEKIDKMSETLQNYELKPAPEVTDKVFIHIHGDAFAKDTGFEGEQMETMLEFMSGYLEKNPLQNQEKQTHIQKLIANCVEANGLLPTWSDPIYHRTFSDASKKLKKFLEKKLSDNEPILLLGGWKGPLGGHAIYYEVGNQEDGKCFFRVYNRGAGFQYHDATDTTGLQIKEKRPAYVEIRNIDPKNLLDENTLLLLIEYKNAQRTTGEDLVLSDKDIYEVFLPLLGGERLERDLDLEDLMGPQHSGTCVWKSFSALMKKNLGHHDYKIFKKEFKKYTLESFFDSNMTLGSFRPNTLLWNLFTKSLEKYARMIEKMHATLTPEQFQEELDFIKGLTERMAAKELSLSERVKERYERKTLQKALSVTAHAPQSPGDINAPSGSVTVELTPPITSSALNCVKTTDLESPELFLKNLKIIGDTLEASYQNGNYDDVIESYVELMDKFYGIMDNSFENITRLPIRSIDTEQMISLLSKMHHLYFKSSLAATEPTNFDFERALASLATQRLICHAAEVGGKDISIYQSTLEKLHDQLNSSLSKRWEPGFFSERHYTLLRSILTSQPKPASTRSFNPDPNSLYQLKNGYFESIAFIKLPEYKYTLNLLKYNEEFRKKAFEEYPQIARAFESDQVSFLLNSWNEKLFPPEFIALRKQTLECSILIGEKLPDSNLGTLPPPEVLDDYIANNPFTFVRADNSGRDDYPVHVKCFVFDRSSLAGLKQQNKKLFNNVLSRAISSQERGMVDEERIILSQANNPENFKSASKREFQELLTLQVPCVKQRSPGDCIAVFTAANQALVERTLVYFTENPQKLTDADYRTLCESVIFQSVHKFCDDGSTVSAASVLSLFLEKQPNAHEALVHFCSNGYKHFQKLDHIQGMVFFLRLSHFIRQFDHGEGFPNTSEELIYLANRPEELTPDERALIHHVFLETVDIGNREFLPHILKSLIEVNKRSLSEVDDHPAIRRHVRKTVQQLQLNLQTAFEESSEARDHLLNLMTSYFIGAENISQWEGPWPIYKDKEGHFTIDASRGLVYTEKGAEGTLTDYIRTDPIYLSLFNQKEKVFQVSAGLYEVVSEKGELYRLYIKDKKLVVERQWENHWYRLHPPFYLKSDYFPTEDHTFWGGNDDKGKRILIYDKNNSLRYIEEPSTLFPGSFSLKRVRREGETDDIYENLCLATNPYPFLENVSHVDDIGIWVSGFRVQLIEFEGMGIGFKIRSGYDKEKKAPAKYFDSLQYPGYYLKDNQYIKPLLDRGIKDYLLLENEAGEQKIIIPRKDIIEMKGNRIPADGRYEVYDFSFDKMKARRLKAQTAEGSLYLAFRMLATKSTEGYKVANELLDISNFNLTTVDEDTIEMLDWILVSFNAKGSPSNDHDARAVALYLKAQLLREKLVNHMLTQKGVSNDFGLEGLENAFSRIESYGGGDFTRWKIIASHMREYASKYGNVGSFKLQPEDEMSLLHELDRLGLIDPLLSGFTKYVTLTNAERLQANHSFYPISNRQELSSDMSDLPLSLSELRELSKKSSETGGTLSHYMLYGDYNQRDKGLIKLLSRPFINVQYNSLCNGLKTISANIADKKDLKTGLDDLIKGIPYSKNNIDPLSKLLQAAMEELFLYASDDELMSYSQTSGGIGLDDSEDGCKKMVLEILLPAAQKLLDRAKPLEHKIHRLDIPEGKRRRYTEAMTGKPKSELLIKREHPKTPPTVPERFEDLSLDKIDDLLEEVQEEDLHLGLQSDYTALLENLNENTQQNHSSPLQNEIRRLEEDKTALYKTLDAKQRTMVASIKKELFEVSAQGSIANEDLVNLLDLTVRSNTETLAEMESSIMQEVARSLSPLQEMGLLGESMHNVTLEELLLSYARREIPPESPLYQMLHDYLMLGIQTQVFIRALDIVDYGDSASSEIARKNLAAELTKENVSEAPEFLVLQYWQNILIRQDQKDEIDRLMNPDPKVRSGLVLQKIMGSGKTSVLMTLLALQRADGYHLSVMTVPDQLLHTVSDELRGRLGNLFGQRIHPFSMTRDKSFNVENLIRIDDTLQKAIRDKDCLIATPQTMHTMHLKYLEYCHDFKTLNIAEEQVAFETLLKVCGDPSKNIKDIESSTDIPFFVIEILRNMNEKELLPKEKLFFMNQLQMYSSDSTAKRCINYLKSSTEFEVLHKIYKTFKERGLALMDEIDLQLNCRHDVNFPIGEGKQIPPHEQDLILDMYSILLENEKIRSKIKYDFNPKLAGEAASLFSEEVYKKEIIPILSSKISKKITERYSLDPKEQKKLSLWLLKDESVVSSLGLSNAELRDVVVLAKEEIHCFLPLSLNKKCDEHYGLSEEDPTGMAICYKSGKPLEGVHFANPHETGNYTLQTLLKHGVPEVLVKKTVDPLIAMISKDFNETGEIDESSDAFQAFIAIAGPRYANRIFKITAKDIKAITDDLNLVHAKQLQFAKNFILPQIVLHTKKLNGNAQTLVTLFKDVQGFSGTLANKDTFHDKLRAQPDVGTDSKTIHLLLKMERLQGANQAVSIVEKGTAEVISGRAAELARQGVNVRAVIDTGGYLLDVNPEELPSHFMALPNVTGVLCHNSEHQLTVSQSNKAPVSATQSQLKPKETFTIYRQPYATGTDIKQAPDAVALVTIGKFVVLRDLLQSVWRMRGIEGSQKVHFIIEKDVEKVIRKTLNLADDEAIKTSDIIQFAIFNQGNLAGDDNFISLKQKLNGVILSRIMTYLMDEGTSNDALSRYSEAIDAFLIPNSPDNALEMYGGVNDLKEREIVIQKLLDDHVAKFEKLNLPQGKPIRHELEAVVKRELLTDLLPDRSNDNTNQTKEVEKQSEKAVMKEVQKEIVEVDESKKVEWGRKGWILNGHKWVARLDMTDLPKIEAYLYPLNQYLGTDPTLAELSRHFDGRILISSNLAPVVPEKANSHISRPFDSKQKQKTFLALVERGGVQYVAIVDLDDSSAFVKAGYPIFMLGSVSNPGKWLKYPIQPKDVKAEVLDIHVADEEELITQVKIFSGHVPKSPEDIKSYRKWLQGKDPREMKRLFVGKIWRDEPNKAVYWKRIKKIMI